MVRRGVNGHTLPPDVGDSADIFVRVQIEHESICAARHIDTPLVIVDTPIINAAVAHELGRVENFIRSGGGVSKSVACQQADTKQNAREMRQFFILKLVDLYAQSGRRR